MCSLGCPGTSSLDQAGLKLTASKELGFKACVYSSDLCVQWFCLYVCLVTEEMREGVGCLRTATMGGCELPSRSLGTEPESSAGATNALNH